MNPLCGMTVFNLDNPDEQAIIKFWEALNEANRKSLVKHIIQGHHHMICREIQALNKNWCEYYGKARGGK